MDSSVQRLGEDAVQVDAEALVERLNADPAISGILVKIDLDRLLEKLRQQGARLISVTPVHRTLEDYFLSKTKEEEKEAVTL